MRVWVGRWWVRREGVFAAVGIEGDKEGEGE